MKKTKIKIARVATVPFAFLGSRELLRMLDRDVDLSVICSEGDFSEELQSCLSKKVQFISISREINIINDIISVYKLFKYFRKEKFTIVHSNTPKGGIVCALAGFLSRTPIRIHTFTGQRWSTIKGLKRLLLKFIDKLICSFNTMVYADSASQIDFLVNEGIVRSGRIKLLGNGAFAGISLKRFENEVLIKDICFSLDLNRDEETLIIGFVGRVVKDKGIELLLEGLFLLREQGFDVKLLVIGPYEISLDPISDHWKGVLEKESSFIQKTGFMERPELAMAHCDLICLPSFREGFPMVVLEAAAQGKPAIVSRISGCIDTITEGETGFTFSLDQPRELVDRVKNYYNDRWLMKNHGAAAKERVEKEFTEEIVYQNQLNEYKRLYEKII